VNRGGPCQSFRWACRAARWGWFAMATSRLLTGEETPPGLSSTLSGVICASRLRRPES
jgi:hypothetical protein